MPRSKHSKRRAPTFGTGALIQGGVLSYRLTDFVDYPVPKTNSNNDAVAQYALAPLNTIPGMFGTSDDLKKVSLPAPRLKKFNLSCLPYPGARNSETSLFTVRAACPIAYPFMEGFDLGTSSDNAAQAAWNQQATLVTPTVNPNFVRVATWDFRKIPNGAVLQTVVPPQQGEDNDAVMGVVNFQVLNVNADTQYKTDTEELSVIQFKIDLEFELPMPSLSQIRNFYGVANGQQFFTQLTAAAKAGDSNVYLVVDGFRRDTETLPSTNSLHGRTMLRLSKQVSDKARSSKWNAPPPYTPSAPCSCCSCM